MEKYKKSLFVVMLLSLSALPGVTFADNSTKSIVTDSNNNVVTSILSGECVRTKWDGGQKECKAGVSSQSLIKKKFTSKSHNRSYIVFFNHNKFDLSVEAKGVLSNLFNDVKKAKRAVFDLVGHADRSGNDDYNMNLSQKRADSVKNYLINLGVKSGNVKSTWEGESKPLVQTEDGIKEPQNRRAEIKVTTEIVE